jgi:hypothetical protein
MYKAEGPDMVAGMTFYLGPDAALATPEHPSGFREFRRHDTITDEQYAAATPETQRLIDNLVEREVLVKTKTKAAPAAEKE